MKIKQSSCLEQERIAAKYLGYTPGVVQEQTVVERFATILSQFSNHEAIKTSNSSFTYRQLDSASNRIASAILNSGSDKPSPVILIAESSALAVIGILGILKAGKFYIPLEISAPLQVLRNRLDTIGKAMIVTDAEKKELCQKLGCSKNSVIKIDESGSEHVQIAKEIHVKPDDLVCVTFSSGSTGNVKGVMQSNRSIMRMIFSSNGLGHWHNSRVAQFASFIYTGSLFEVFGPLLSGSTLCPYKINSACFEALARWLDNFKITCAGFAPTVFRMLCSVLEPGQKFLEVRRLVLGGDAITSSDIELYRQHFPNALLVTGFASSEAGKITTYNIDQSMQNIPEPVPAGYVDKGYNICIVDENRVEMVSGEVGEIAVTSAFLSPGYWKNEVLTQKKFSTSMLVKGLRTYYTGDRGFMSEDGCLTLIGRVDNVVKVNAQMVDLNEVEKVIVQLESVAQVAVVVMRNWKGGERLVAHVVTNPGHSPLANSLRVELLDMLPLFMIPALFVFTDALPLTKNNKVDRQKLMQNLQETL